MRVFHSTAVSTNLLLIYSTGIHIFHTVSEKDYPNPSVSLIRLIYDNTMSTVTVRSHGKTTEWTHIDTSLHYLNESNGGVFK